MTARFFKAPKCLAALAALAISAFAAAPASAAPERTGFYGSFNIGAQVGNSAEVRSNGLALKAQLKTTYSIGVTAGYKWDVPGIGKVRTEVEGNYVPQRSNVDAFGLGPVTDTNFDEYRVTANVWYDFETTGRLKPYIGGGIGWSFLRNAPFLDNESGLAYQFGGGVRMDLTPDGRTYAGIGYRYQGFADRDQDLANLLGGAEVDLHGKGHRLMVEIGHFF